MNKYLKTTIGRLRLIGFLEGLSLLFLLVIAMPFKYVLGQPLMVQVVGSLHGGLFLLFVFYVLYCKHRFGWKYWPLTIQLLIASFIPFGTFYMDSRVLSKMEAEAN